MRQFALWLVFCAALPAQQIRISGSDENSSDGSVRAEEMDDSLVVTLPGSGQTPSSPKESTAASASPRPVSVPALSLPAPSAIPSNQPPANPRATGLNPLKAYFPPEFEHDSAFFCQKLIGAWTEDDAYNLLGAPLRRRSAFDSDRSVNGQILAYADPTGHYRQIELDFAQNTGLLRTVFVYPFRMSWQECRRLWGANVQSTEANKGRTFYSYVNRRLDVLVDAGGNVISLGLY
ncbi:MAG TPA: hypothetical protein VMA31_15270 [Bryobacteraceae bacterium]|nr:hypothetical protein [Bryobacteraceae bacterium]